MRPLPQRCEQNNTVTSFCDCMKGERVIDPAAEAFCRWASQSDAHVTGDDLAELKKALKDIEGTDPDESCGDC